MVLISHRSTADGAMQPANPERAHTGPKDESFKLIMDAAKFSSATVGNSTDLRQDNGALDDKRQPTRALHAGTLSSTAVGTGADTDRKNSDDNRKKHSDNGILASASGLAHRSQISDRPNTQTTNYWPKSQIEKLVQLLRRTTSAGKSSLFVTLHIPGVGDVKFNVRRSKGKIYINAYVADHNAAAVLTCGAAELKAHFAQNDLQLGGFEITNESIAPKQRQTKSSVRRDPFERETVAPLPQLESVDDDTAMVNIVA